MEEEKRTVMGVGEVKWGAEVRVEALGEGVKVPVRRWPLAWAMGDWLSICSVN